MVGRLLMLTLALGLLTGCQTAIDAGKLVGLIRPPELVLDRPMPADFLFSMEYRALESRDHTGTLAFTADGSLSYKFEYPGTTRPTRIGEEQVSEEAVQRIWRLLGELEYDELDDDGYRYDGEPDRTWGEREFFVRAGEQEKRVVASYVGVPQLDRLQALVFEVTPEAIFSSDYTGRSGPSVAPDHWIGDRESGLFYPSDSEELKEVPEARRIVFDTVNQALDSGFHPKNPADLQRSER